jgi:hypothetical protein
VKERRPPPTVPTDRLALPRTETRARVNFRQRAYRLRRSETDILATVGAFRVVRADDLANLDPGRTAAANDLRSLTEQGLAERRTVEINREMTSVVVLTEEGKSLIEGHRISSTDGKPEQQFYAGLAKPREVAHDAQIFRLYRAEGARIEAGGGRITRVVLDYELKREYQRHLNRPDRPDDSDRAQDLQKFAYAHDLPVRDGHLELPDLRIEYETADGRVEHRDVELVTEHYSRGQMAGKSQAGFTLYRAAGARSSGDSRRGGTPYDPHILERLS